jgi:Protein of unknown function (DUF998)
MLEAANWTPRLAALARRARASAAVLRIYAGIAGPAAFTGAWMVSSLRQTGYPAAEIQISGLAAPDARDPWIMVAGFVVLGGCTVAFGAALREALDGRGGVGPGRGVGLGRAALREALDGRGGVGPGRGVGRGRGRGGAGLAPRLIQGAGLLTIAAGLLRRDRMLLTPGSVSWHNHAHDVVSAVIYVDLVVAQVLLAERFGRDPAGLDPSGPSWAPWRPWLLASGLATGAALIAFAAVTPAAEAGVLQRVAVTIPLAAIAAIAVRLLRTAARSGWP